MDRDRRRRGHRQPERPVRALGRGVEAFAVQQPTYLPCHRRQPVDGCRERHVVEPLGQRRAAGPEAEDEAATRDLVERRSQHRDAGWGTAPHVEYAGAERDPAGTCRDLGQQHRGVVAPPLREEEGVVTQVFRPLRDMQHDRAAGFHRSQADSEALPGHACTLRPGLRPCTDTHPGGLGANQDGAPRSPCGRTTGAWPRLPLTQAGPLRLAGPFRNSGERLVSKC